MCPDSGTCHHECRPGPCFRVLCCGPLSGVYPENEWPAEVTKLERLIEWTIDSETT